MYVSKYTYINLDIYSSPFYLPTAQSQGLVVIERDGSLNGW